MAQTIQQEVIRQGGLSLKAVVCPPTLKPQTGETIECTGELDTGYTFTIPVKWKDDKGDFSWEIPNAKGLLNLTKFESMIRDSVKTEIGTAPVIRCGTTLYRAVRAGEKFECQMAAKPAEKPVGTEAKPEDKPATPEVAAPEVAAPEVAAPEVAASEPPRLPQPDRIAVTVDADRNISWQRLLGGVSPQPASTAASPGSSAARPADSAPIASPAAPATNAPGNPSKPAASVSNAEDFRNQPNASDQFED